MWLRGDREHLFVQIYLFGININIQSLFRIELLLVGGAFLGDCGIIKFIGTYSPIFSTDIRTGQSFK